MNGDQKSDVKRIFTEMNGRNQIQQENIPKEVVSSINEFFNNAHDKVAATVEQKLNVFMGKKCLQLMIKTK